MRTRMCYCLALALVFALSAQGLTPFGKVMLSARAAKAAKKQEEKAAEAKEKQQDLAKLRARYPKEMAEIDQLQAKDAAAAQKRLIALALKYESETGEKLPAVDAPAKPEKEGPIRRGIDELRLRERPSQAAADTATVERPAAAETSYPGKRVFNRLERRFEQVEGLFESDGKPDSPRK